MATRKANMARIVNESIESGEFQPDQRWGLQLMRLYARQIDSATRIKAEVMAVLDESDTASKSWHQRLVYIEKYINAESLLNNTGPKLLVLMEKFGMTPALSKVKRGGESDGGEAKDEVEDELAALRQQRGQSSRPA